jgi:disulfide bond formation protein DsbB
VTDAVTTTLAALGIVGQIALVLVVLAALASWAGISWPLDWLRGALWGYELWLAFLVAAMATLGSLFFSEIADFVPCELCWIQRIFMYPLAIVTLALAVANDHRASRYLLPLPVIGAGFSVYHLLVENGVVEQSQACLISAPGGCATKWIEEFGYVTIPTLALTAFLLVFTFLLAASVGVADETETGEATESGADAASTAWGGVPASVAKLLVLGLVLTAGLLGWLIGRSGDGASAESITTTTSTTTTTDPSGSEPVGQVVFMSAACGGCHTLGAAGSTSTIGPNLDATRPSAEVVIDAVSNGRQGMPAFDDQLSAEQIREVAAYVAAAAGS